MAEHGFHLVQFTVSRLSAPLDDPRMREFVEFLAPVTGFADATGSTPSAFTFQKAFDAMGGAVARVV